MSRGSTSKSNSLTNTHSQSAKSCLLQAWPPRFELGISRIEVSTTVRASQLSVVIRGYQHFRLTYCLHVQGIMKMEAVCLSETSVPTSRNTQYHNQGEEISSFRLWKRHSIEGIQVVFHSDERWDEVWSQTRSCRQNYVNAAFIANVGTFQ